MDKSGKVFAGRVGVRTLIIGAVLCGLQGCDEDPPIHATVSEARLTFGSSSPQNTDDGNNSAIGAYIGYNVGHQRFGGQKGASRGALVGAAVGSLVGSSSEEARVSPEEHLVAARLVVTLPEGSTITFVCSENDSRDLARCATLREGDAILIYPFYSSGRYSLETPDHNSHQVLSDEI